MIRTSLCCYSNNPTVGLPSITWSTENAPFTPTKTYIYHFNQWSSDLGRPPLWF